MRAAVRTRYGPPEVVELRGRRVPTPGPGELLVRVRASAVSSAVRRIRALDPPRGFGPPARPALGFARPRRPVLGTEPAGDVVALGEGAIGFAPGDAVLAFPGAGLGAHEEYACVRAERAAPKPPGLDWAQAAALCFGGTAMLEFYRRGALAEGDRVLVNGASGTVGTAAVRLACDAGARVTGVCSADAAGLVRALGAERVIDPGAEDFARSPEQWDVIVDVAGTAPWRRCVPVLAPRGRLDEVARRLGDAHGVECVPIAADLSQREACARIEAVTARLDVGLLVAAAGFGTSGALLDSDPDEEAAMLAVNCTAVLVQASHFGRRFVRRGRGGIVLMSSLLGFHGTPGAANYAATKASVQSLAEGLHAELGPAGVDVIASAPGPVASGFASRAGMRMARAQEPASVARGTLDALGRRGTVRPGALSKLLGGSISTAPRALRVRIMGRMTAHRRAAPGLSPRTLPPS